MFAVKQWPKSGNLLRHQTLMPDLEVVLRE